MKHYQSTGDRALVVHAMEFDAFNTLMDKITCLINERILL